MEAREDPEFLHDTRSAIFIKTADFNKVSIYLKEDLNQQVVRPVNPHSRRSDNWALFEDFRTAHTFYAAGDWPAKTLLKKTEVAFEYFLFGRRIPVFDPLTETDNYDIVLDVEEAAVYSVPS